MNRIHTTSAAFLLTAAISTSAGAQGNGPVLKDWQFGKSGNWNVLYLSRDQEGRQFGNCVMEQIYASEVALRIGIRDTDVVTIDFMGAASMETEAPFDVRYYIDAPDQGTDAGSFALKEGDETPMWRRFEEPLDNIGGIADTLARGKRLVIRSGSKQWSYALAGAAPAFESVKACFTQYNPGKALAGPGARPPAPPPMARPAAPPPPVMAAPPPPPPPPPMAAAPAAPVAAAGGGRVPFGQTKDWRVDKVMRGANTVACIGQGTTPPFDSLRFVIDAKSMHFDWKDGFTRPGERFPVTLGFGTDVNGHGDFQATVISDESGLWARISQTRDEPGFEDGLANSTQVWLKSPKNMFSMPLDGTNKMFAMFFRCMDTIR